MQLARIHHDTEASPFEQVRAQIAAQIASGQLPSGTRLPTVRALAAELDLAVNTVARAYKELEGDGLVVTEGRRGTSVCSTSISADVRAASSAYVQACRRQGLTHAEAVRLVEEGWNA